jgi:hypothetical protein
MDNRAGQMFIEKRPKSSYTAIKVLNLFNKLKSVMFLKLKIVFFKFKRGYAFLICYVNVLIHKKITLIMLHHEK